MKGLRKALLRWYDAEKRDLPWRRDADPYRVLVSEMMLQQTQVKTVLPYYEKFLAQFPTADKLAAAPESRVLRAWAGLGYYRRASFLQSAARAVQGGFPRTEEGLLGLPGIGSYTAAAVGSICFGLALPVVDGNVIRVIARILALDPDAKSAAGLGEIRRTASALLDPQRPGDFNQAVMELGALICTPRKPLCQRCPVSKSCKALASGDPEAYPRLPQRAKPTQVRKAVALVTQGGAVLCAARQGKGRMIGMWHFPEAELAPSQDPAEAAAGLALRCLGGPCKALGKCGSLSHTVTRYRIRLDAYRFVTKASKPPKAPWSWISRESLKALPLASAERRLASMLEPSA